MVVYPMMFLFWRRGCHPGMRRPAPRAYIAGLHAWTTEVWEEGMIKRVDECIWMPCGDIFYNMFTYLSHDVLSNNSLLQWLSNWNHLQGAQTMNEIGHITHRDLCITTCYYSFLDDLWISISCERARSRTGSKQVSSLPYYFGCDQALKSDFWREAVVIGITPWVHLATFHGCPQNTPCPRLST